MIDRQLTDQAIDKLLSSGDARLRRCGGRIFRSRSGEPAIEKCGILTRNVINQIESESGEVLSDELRSMLLSVKERLRICEDNHRQLANEVNDIARHVLDLTI